MKKLKEILNVFDELNLYLTVNDLKPATMISLNALNPLLATRVTKNEKLIKKVRNVTLKVNSDVVDDLKKYLNDSEINYENREQKNISKAWNSQGNKIMQQICYDHMFYVGSSKKNLKELLSAKNDRETGLALGFPTDAVDAYRKIIDGERRDGSYFSVSLARAKQAGMELPTWLAYISFVPENLNLIKGNISSSSQKLAKIYQTFVMLNNFDLAKRVEQLFSDRKHPDSWQKTFDGGYSCCYKTKKVIL